MAASETPFVLLRLDMRGHNQHHETETIETGDQLVAVANPTRVHVRSREGVINLLLQATRNPLSEGLIHEAFRDIKREREFDAVLCVFDGSSVLVTPHRQNGRYIVTRWKHE